ncbi:MAG TPA: hypothetical protein VLZ74_04665 [Methylocella sp.]|nr:hypothetical protein [Methylocella sp.]
MRMFFGIIIGIILTVGAAYLADTVRDTSNAEGSTNRPIVNWDVVDNGIKALSTTLQEGWARVTGHAKDNAP